MTLGPQGIEWETTQVGITAGKSSLLLCLSRGRTHREKNTHTHTEKNTAMPVTPLDHRGQGENYWLRRRLSKRGDADTLATLPNGGVFTVLLGLWRSWWDGGVEPVLPSEGATHGWWSIGAGEGLGREVGDWEGQLLSLCAVSGSGRTGARWP